MSSSQNNRCQMTKFMPSHHTKLDRVYKLPHKDQMPSDKTSNEHNRNSVERDFSWTSRFESFSTGDLIACIARFADVVDDQTFWTWLVVACCLGACSSGRSTARCGCCYRPRVNASRIFRDGDGAFFIAGKSMSGRSAVVIETYEFVVVECTFCTKD